MWWLLVPVGVAYLIYRAVTDDETAKPVAKVTLVGPRLSGKTSLLRYLAKRELADPGERRTYAVSDERVELHGVSLSFNVADVPGSEPGDGSGATQGIWKRACEEADQVWFVADVHRLQTDNRYKERALRDGQHLARFASDTRLGLVLTHADQTTDNGESWESSLHQPEVHELQVHLNCHDRTVIGSLAHEESAQHIADTVASWVA